MNKNSSFCSWLQFFVIPLQSVEYPLSYSAHTMATPTDNNPAQKSPESLGNVDKV